jgi:hypothetical protein
MRARVEPDKEERMPVTTDPDRELLDAIERADEALRALLSPLAAADAALEEAAEIAWRVTTARRALS